LQLSGVRNRNYVALVNSQYMPTVIPAIASGVRITIASKKIRNVASQLAFFLRCQQAMVTITDKANAI
jgi:hypothetical protein